MVQGVPVPHPVTHCPPKSCIPKRAKTTMKRKRRKRRLMMDFMEFRRETTRFRREAQYLPGQSQAGGPPGDRGHRDGDGTWGHGGIRGWRGDTGTWGDMGMVTGHGDTG